ncbi:MAG: HK97 family phage prohead protease [Paracoccus sp. (in: a-proteobacteria)]|uniref:HK97 family phage prohead protease n=1 Tax=Paracoccus sp. TaxID=267 RepID=UPI0026DFA102|nr:HK97 family phage prohead protease [Paracoccus sp. (in: a-proteobacteria)]MDO5621925.1 HK97 family phage prohead protease [Paracoccus sp. (in: a-proteobacteria)]
MQVKHGAALLDIKSLGEKGQFEGYASTFGGEPDSYGDIIAPGAYSESLAEHAAKGTMPKMFWQHDPREPIGKWLSAVEDDKGLSVTGQLNMGVQRGREAYELLKAGDIDGLSIGYRIKGYEVDEDRGIWTLTKLALHEVSVVSIGANENATIAAVKSERRVHEVMEKLRAGDRLTEREFEDLLKGAFGLSNSQAERAVRVHLKGRGEPAAAADGLAFLRALAG